MNGLIIWILVTIVIFVLFLLFLCDKALGELLVLASRAVCREQEYRYIKVDMLLRAVAEVIEDKDDETPFKLCFAFRVYAACLIFAVSLALYVICVGNGTYLSRTVTGFISSFVAMGIVALVFSAIYCKEIVTKSLEIAIRKVNTSTSSCNSRYVHTQEEEAEEKEEE